MHIRGQYMISAQLQYSLGIWRRRDPAFYIQPHAGKQERPLFELCALDTQFLEVEQLAYWHTPAGEKDLV